MEKPKDWYQNSLYIIGTLIVFFPLGLFLMWRFAKWKKPIKIGVTCLLAFLLLMAFADNESGPSQSARTDDQAGSQETNQVITPTNTPVPTLTPFHLKVENLAIKQVDGKYRYFFDIRNEDEIPFEGIVTIIFIDDRAGHIIGTRDFGTDAPVEPGSGNSVYVDATRGPASAYGGTPLTKFKFEAKGQDGYGIVGEGKLLDYVIE